MVDGRVFDKLEFIARAIRGCAKPFGGIQLVLTGDFFQLPPVPPKNGLAKFLFEAEEWTRCVKRMIVLNHVFRQKDEEFAAMLNEIRLGKMSEQTMRHFQGLHRPLDLDDGIEPTELFVYQIRGGEDRM